MEFQIVLASHGSLAEGMLSAVKMIAGEHDNVSAFGLDTWQTPQAIDEQVQKIREAHPDQLLLLVCDIAGGSVHNQLVLRAAEKNTAVLAGMNLPCVLSLVLMQTETMTPAGARKVLEEAKDSLTWTDEESFKAKEEEEEDQLW